MNLNNSRGKIVEKRIRHKNPCYGTETRIVIVFSDSEKRENFMEMGNESIKSFLDTENIILNNFKKEDLLKSMLNLIMNIYDNILVDPTMKSNSTVLLKSFEYFLDQIKKFNIFVNDDFVDLDNIDKIEEYSKQLFLKMLGISMERLAYSIRDCQNIEALLKFIEKSNFDL